MSVYLIADLEILDRAAIDDYRAKAFLLVERYGGRLIGSDEAPLIVEGDCTSTNLIIIEFPSRQAIRDLLRSEEYAPLARQRQAAARSRLVVVDGV